MLIQVIGAFLAVITMSVILSIPRKFLIYSGVVGAVGWFVYLLMLKLGAVVTMGIFVATLVAALISHTFARIFKAPVTVFLIPAILPTVPGVGMYRIVYYMIIGNSDMTGYYFSQTLQIAGMIAIAIFIMDTLFRIAKRPPLERREPCGDIKLECKDLSRYKNITKSENLSEHKNVTRSEDSSGYKNVTKSEDSLEGKNMTKSKDLSEYENITKSEDLSEDKDITESENLFDHRRNK